MSPSSSPHHLVTAAGQSSRMSDQDASVRVARRQDGGLIVQVSVTGQRGGKRAESVILAPGTAGMVLETLAAEWAAAGGAS